MARRGVSTARPGLRAWRVVSADAGLDWSSSLDLETAPLAVRRAYRVDGPALTVDNDRPQRLDGSVEFLWGEHPTYRRGLRARSGPRDRRETSTSRPPTACRRERRRHDRVAWTAPSSPAVRPYAGAFTATLPVRVPRRRSPRGRYRLRNDRLGLAARLSWPMDVFPCVWLWEEIASPTDAPWNGQAYAVGIEPHVAYPAVGMTELRRRGGHGLTLGPGRPWLQPLPSAWSASMSGREVTDARAPAGGNHRPGQRLDGGATPAVSGQSIEGAARRVCPRAPEGAPWKSNDTGDRRGRDRCSMHRSGCSDRRRRSVLHHTGSPGKPGVTFKRGMGLGLVAVLALAGCSSGSSSPAASAAASVAASVAAPSAAASEAPSAAASVAASASAAASASGSAAASASGAADL